MSLFIFCIPQRLPCSRIFPASGMIFLLFHSKLALSKQALSKARQFINPSLFKELYYLSVDLFYKQIPSRKLWNGYHLFAVDGSRIELPNSQSTFDFFGEMSSFPDPDRCYTMALASIIYDVLDDYIVHASIHKFLSSERKSKGRSHFRNKKAAL